MKKIKHFSAITILTIGALLIMTGRVDAIPYAFSVDRFQVVGNLPGNVFDEFDNGVLAPWYIDNGTAIEAGGALTLTNPGDINTRQINNYLVTREESDIYRVNSGLGVADGAGDFVATSTWVTGVPAQNQFYLMESDIETLNFIDLDEIQLGVYNIGPILANVLGIPAGLSVTFNKNIGVDNTTVVSQSVFFAEGDITGDILLSLIFNDSTNQFTGAFSLDGGTTFQSPFSPIDTRIGQGLFLDWELTAVSFEVQPIPEPSTLLLLGSGLAGLVGFGRRRLFKKT